jgi:hypothetical protein
MILATFPFSTIPFLIALSLTSNHSFLMGYVQLLVLTPFMITLSIFLQFENMRHFRESAKNSVRYFVP